MGWEGKGTHWSWELNYAELTGTIFLMCQSMSRCSLETGSSRPRPKAPPSALYLVSLMAPPLCSHYPWPRISVDHISTLQQPLSYWDPSPNSISSASHLGLVWLVVAFSSPNSETMKNISLQGCCIKIPHTHRDTPTHLHEKGACSLSQPLIHLQGTSNRSVSSTYWNKHQSNQLFGIMWAKYK